MTEHARHAGRRTPSAGTPDGAGQERVVSRDKRKINVSNGKHAQSADAEAANAEAFGEQVDNDAPEVLTDAQAGGGLRDDDAAATAQPVERVDEAQPPALGAELASLRGELDERIGDLQRVSAEFANYRKRVDRDRALVAEQATGHVLAALLPVLDDLDRAREHGDLVGPFGTVAEQMATVVSKFGLTPFGMKGDRFDPTRHEAVAHLTSAEVTEPTCVDVMRRGYLLGE
ncbi:MAG: molecular chaperone GrpE, partial [Micromonosporaceae bacterium]|nr:molecular chaperone GrpE [Micromonosporaceae bacterium]